MSDSCESTQLTSLLDVSDSESSKCFRLLVDFEVALELGGFVFGVEDNDDWFVLVVEVLVVDAAAAAARLPGRPRNTRVDFMLSMSSASASKSLNLKNYKIV